MPLQVHNTKQAYTPVCSTPREPANELVKNIALLLRDAMQAPNDEEYIKPDLRHIYEEELVEVPAVMPCVDIEVSDMLKVETRGLGTQPHEIYTFSATVRVFQAPLAQQPSRILVRRNAYAVMDVLKHHHDLHGLCRFRPSEIQGVSFRTSLFGLENPAWVVGAAIVLLAYVDVNYTYNDGGLHKRRAEFASGKRL